MANAVILHMNPYPNLASCSQNKLGIMKLPAKNIRMYSQLLSAFVALVGTFLLVSPTKSVAATVTINFDSVDTSQFTATGAPVDATAYLASYGVTLSAVSPSGSTTSTGLVGILNDSAGYQKASSGDNFLEQSVSGSPAESFTMDFSTALSSFGFTRIENLTPNLTAGWTATAYSGSTALASVAEPFGLDPFSAATYNLVGPDITSVTFTANGFNVAGIPGAPIDDLVLTTPSSVPDASSTFVLLMLAFGALAGVNRRQRRVA
jgi:hypothetical protein